MIVLAVVTPLALLPLMVLMSRVEDRLVGPPAAAAAPPPVPPLSLPPSLPPALPTQDARGPQLAVAP